MTPSIIAMIILASCGQVSDVSNNVSADDGSQSGQVDSYTKDSVQTSIQEAANLLLMALIDRDVVVLREFASDDRLFFTDDGDLLPEISQFLYNSNAMSLLSSEVARESYTTGIIDQGNNVFTIIIVLKEDDRGLDDLQFLETQWMERYLACELRRVPSGRFVFHENVCFAETDGPFPPQSA